MRRMPKSERSKTVGQNKCPSGKLLSFDTVEEALVGLRESAARARRLGRDTVPVRYYDCQFCGKMHLTAKPYQSINDKIIDAPPAKVPALVTPEGRFYTVENAAKLLDMPVGKLRRQIRRGRFTANNDRIPAKEIDDIVD